MSIHRWQSGTSRRRRSRPQRRRILIVCEGRETERNYFDQMKRVGYARDNLAVTVKRGKGGSREEIAQFAVNYKRRTNDPFDEAWCVMDAEKTADRDACEAALRILAANQIEPCLSNPAFEVWLLSHFEKTTNSFLDCAAVVRKLNPRWRAHVGRDYDKAEPEIFKLLSSLTPAAIANARWTREEYHANRSISTCNAATEVYRLVERLLGEAK